MGYGSYTSTDWVKLKNSRGISETSRASDLFRHTEMDDRFNPRFIQMRESCDSADSPESTPIIIGFDVTGSMGYLAEEIAKNSLNLTITQIYEKNPVTNPHILCATIGDTCDRAPLQVTQFEADIRILEQTMDLWLEQAGGDYPEAYNLLWYFADRHTRTDAYEKRYKKGFLFTIGDAPNHDTLSSVSISEIFGDECKSVSNADILKTLSEKYEVFHIITKSSSPKLINDWNIILPDRVAFIDSEHIQNLSDVIISIMQLTNGMAKKDVIAQWPKDVQPVVSRALENIGPDKEKTVSTTKKNSFWPKAF